jgi:hypothetical protein
MDESNPLLTFDKILSMVTDAGGVFDTNNTRKDIAKIATWTGQLTYITNNILINLDLKSKGILAENIVKLYYEDTLKNEYKDLKYGDNQGLDGLFTHIGNNTFSLVEIKFIAEDKKPPYSRLTIAGQPWRQLSTPYIKYEMSRFKELSITDEKESIYKLFYDNVEEIDLFFIAFDAQAFTLDFYNVGKANKSLMD